MSIGLKEDYIGCLPSSRSEHFKDPETIGKTLSFKLTEGVVSALTVIKNLSSINKHPAYALGQAFHNGPERKTAQLFFDFNIHKPKGDFTDAETKKAKDFYVNAVCSTLERLSQNRSSLTASEAKLLKNFENLKKSIEELKNLLEIHFSAESEKINKGDMRYGAKGSGGYRPR